LHVELALIQICNTEQEKKNSSIEVTTPAKTQQTTTGNVTSTPIKSTQPTGTHTQTKPVASAIPSFSLKDALKSDAKPEKKQDTEKQDLNRVQEPSIPANTTQQTSDFTQEQLEVAWLAFTETLKIKNPRLFSTLAAQPPVLKENFIIELSLSNQLQIDEILKIKFELVNFLRNELLNNKIELSTNLSETQQSQRFYTDKEKFDHMAQKNPNLLKFKQQFGLDFG
jgi:DNA polymerase-3 subunit gamma/tau